MTPMDQLEDHHSPPTRALDWILLGMSDDIDRIDTIKERFALATLFFATNGDLSWINHEGWLLLESSTCSWYGVTCSGHDGSIRRLDLSMNGLGSTIPAEIALLNLESLGLFSNNLVGTIPTQLYRMSDLCTFTHYSYEYQGTSPQHAHSR